MGYQHRINKSFENAPVLPLSPSHRYVLFSDCHRGNGTLNDNFIKNQNLYRAALQHYYAHNFTYIELGDGDELWENKNMKQITATHSEIFKLLARFYENNRLYLIYGNHDMVKKRASFAKKECSSYYCDAPDCEEPLFPGVQFYSGLILKDYKTGKSLYLTHGHQVSLLNSTLWPINRFLVRYLWKPLELIGIPDPTSPAKNHIKRKRSEDRLLTWAKQTNRTIIAGHTHRPTISKPYLNTGSCVHPFSVTCIEVFCNQFVLVKWILSVNDNGVLYVKREELASDTIT